ncbi:chemotaxis protein CheW, partial [Treponema pallidum]
MVGDLGHGLGTMIEHMEAEIGIRESFDGGVREPLAVIDFKMVTFSLAGKDYAVDIMQVKEIAKAGSFTYVPNTSPFVLGVYNLRGDIIPIIDLRRFFNIPAPRKSRQAIENMVIVTVEDQTFGVVVDGIDKVIGVS